MNPVKTAWTELVYRGPTPEIGDLWCHRQQPGEIWTVWEPTSEELEILNSGGRVFLAVLTEPLPPVAVGTISAEDSVPVGQHHFKVIPELEERG